MDRITDRHINALVADINRITGSPAEPYTKGDDGHYHANPGNFHLDQAYGGVQLARMVGETGSITVISTTGFGTKRELYNWMTAYIRGLTAVRDAVTV